MDIKIRSIIVFVILAVTFIFMFLLNFQYPFCLDDPAYSILKYDEVFIFPDTFTDIIKFQYYHYLNWGGRSVAHSIVQILLLFNPIIQDIINSLGYVGVVHLIYKISTRYSKKTNIPLLLFISLALWFFIPRFVGNTLWITGSANYLWTTYIILLFISRYHYSFIDKNLEQSKFNIFLFFILGLLAGWTNENMTPVVILMVIFYTIYQYLLTKKISLPYISGLVASIIGCCFLLLAPGNSRRLAVETQKESLINDSFLEKLTTGTEWAMTYMYQYMLPLSILFIFIFIYFSLTKNSENKKTTITTALLFFMASHLAFFLMTIPPQFAPRTMFGMITFEIIACSILLSKIDLTNIFFKYAVYLGLALGIIYFAIDYQHKYKTVSYIGSVFKERHEIVLQEKKKGNEYIVFTNPIYIHYKYDFLDLENVELIYWTQYYKVKSIKVVSPQKR